ncbi:MAG: 4Fe-4S binding protein [Oscillospiraceae bacterium]|jgi:epoxyqueuosine reductase QueG|nr:4Fe-4S binding protein [Oscillospiraceae bacterium]
MVLTEELLAYLRAQGADLAAAGDLRALPPEPRRGLPAGVSVAVKYPKDVIRGIAALPTRAYYDQYNALNETLDRIVEAGARWLGDRGWQAVAQTRALVAQNETQLDTPLPHKTAATRAGLGWIGKSALLVTEEYGCMVRISTILTDAPLRFAAPVDKSRCGACAICAQACPAGAILGKNWRVDLPREAFFNAAACRSTARERAMRGFGVDITVCGKCIAVCPYTRRYLEERP